MKTSEKIVVIDRQSQLADASFRAAVKFIAANGDPHRSFHDAAAVYRRMKAGLKDATGLESFLELVRDGIRAADARGRRARLRPPRMIISPQRN